MSNEEKSGWLSWRSPKAWFAALGLWVVIYFAGSPAESLNCETPEVQSKVVELINQQVSSVMTQFGGGLAVPTLQIYGLKDARALKVDSESGFHACVARTRHDRGEGTTGYTVRWQSKEQGTFLVELADAGTLEAAYGTAPAPSANAPAEENRGETSSADAAESAPAMPVPEPQPTQDLVAPELESESPGIDGDAGSHLAPAPAASIESTSSPVAPSFDCGRTSTAVETLICQDNELALADRRLAAEYATALKQASDPAMMRSSQTQWLRGTRNTCETRDCLLRAYELRSRELNPQVE